MAIKLKDSFKTYSRDLDKLISPEETIQRVRDRLSRTGKSILLKSLRIDTGRLGIPVFISLCGEDAVRTIGARKQMGKGCNPEQAEASALMELVERYSFFRFIKEASFLEVPYSAVQNQALDFHYLPLSVHDPSPNDRRNRTCLETLPLKWIWAMDLCGEREVLIPVDWFYSIHEYNGAAAGNSMEEAVLQALCEVVERHASSVVVHRRLETPTINPSTLSDGAARDLLDRFQRNGIRVFLKDFSLDTGIPTVGALAYDPSTFPESSEIVFTAGTTPHPEKSIIRALTEVAQLAGEFQNRTTYRATLPKFKRLGEADYLTSLYEERESSSLPNLSDQNFYQEIKSCVSVLHRIGLDAFAIDVTCPELGIPAVYVFIPGAHFMDRTRENSVAYHASRLASQLRDEDRALAEMQRLVQLFPERYEVRFFLGYAFERKGLFELAISHFEASLQMDPKPIDVANIYCHMGIVHQARGAYQKAIQMYKVAREHNGALKEVYQQLGFCYFKKGEYEKAIEQFARALEIDPGSAIDYANIGANLRAMGYVQMAIPIYEMALEMDPSLEFARTQLEQIREMNP